MIDVCHKPKVTKLRGIVRTVYKQMGRAIADYNMLKDGDRILVAVSGGLDSLSMLKLFQIRKAHVPINFDLVACFVDTNFIEVERSLIESHFKESGVDYIVKELKLTRDAVNCFWCSWNRRKLLFNAARETGCNVLALGHNLDDISETILMNLMFVGEVSASPPVLEMFDGQIRLIRPLAYLPKREIIAFSRCFDFPDTHHECPWGHNSSRLKVKRVIETLEADFPQVRKNIFRSLRKIKQGYLV